MSWWSPRPADASPARAPVARPALPPIKVGSTPDAIAITPDGKTAYVSLVTAGVIPIRTATNTALPRLKIGYSSAIAITP